MTAEGVRPLVSVIIPCYAQSAFLHEAIGSAVAQTYAPLEVIVVDDGSPDDPAPIAARHPGVRLVSQPNGGRSSARNTGVRASHGDYLVFLDADDLLLPHAAETAMRVFAEHEECAFVFGAGERRTIDGVALAPRSPMVDVPDLYLELLRGCCIHQLNTAVFRRGAFEAVGGFDERRRVAEDWDLYLRLARRFPTFGHGTVVAVYRRTGQNVNARRNAHVMLPAALGVLRAQWRHARTRPSYREAYGTGVRNVLALWRPGLLERLRGHASAGRWRELLRDGALLVRYYPRTAASLAVRRIAGRVGAPPARPRERPS